MPRTKRTPVVETSTLLHPDPKEGPLWVALHWATLNGRNECVGVTIVNGGWLRRGGDDEGSDFEALPGKSLDDLAPLRATQVRIPIDRMVSEHRRAAAALPDGAREIALGIRGWKVPAVRGWGPDHLFAVAQVYLETWQAGGNPTSAVAEHFDVSKSAAAKWVARCRDPEVGLIPPTTRGKVTAAVPKRKRTR